MNIKNIIIFTIACLVILFTLSCKSRTKPGVDKIVVTLDWSPNTNHTGLYAALELGYFDDEGLEVHIMEPGQAMTDQVVASGTSHFGISYQENVTRARSEGIPLVSLAAVIQHNTSGFASLREAGINTPKDFEGKRYGSWDSPSEVAILKTVMSNHKADDTKIEIVSGVYDFFSTIGKDADFEWIFDGWTGVEARLRGIELSYIPLRNMDPAFDYYTPVIITNDKLIEQNPELVKRFMRAVFNGYTYCIANPDQAADILLKHVPELDARLVKASQNYLSKEYQAEAKKWGIQSESVWASFYQWMKENKLLEGDFEIQSAYTNEFLP